MEDVVIAGAGPVGLWLARELRLAGVGVVVLERATERSSHSKALTIHPRTLEVLAMRGVHDDLLADGLQIPSGHFGVLESRLGFGSLDTEFPFTLAQPQVRTEELLEQYAHAAEADIRRGHTVTGLAQNDESVTVEVEGPGGQYQIQAQYLVGCDGASSTVRKQAGFSFPGTDSTTFGFLGDVVLDNPPKQIGFSTHTSRGCMMIAPLPGGLFRFVGVDPNRQDTGPTELEFDEFRQSVVAAAGTDFGMRDPVWLSRFGNASRQATHYRHGRVLLAGDAAHIHFPTGGVGLNVGVQDAMNLGWKLAAQVRGHAAKGLLDSYHAERHPVGAALLENSLAQTAVITAFSPEGQALRALLNQLIADHPQLSLDLAERLSALNVEYRPDAEAHRLVGRRTPNLELTGTPSHLYSLLHAGQPVLLYTRALETARGIAERHSVTVHRAQIASTGRPDWEAATALLVRPDGHIAWATDDTTSAVDTEARNALADLFTVS